MNRDEKRAVTGVMVFLTAVIVVLGAALLLLNGCATAPPTAPGAPQMVPAVLAVAAAADTVDATLVTDGQAIREFRRRFAGDDSAEVVPVIGGRDDPLMLAVVFAPPFYRIGGWVLLPGHPRALVRYSWTTPPDGAPVDRYNVGQSINGDPFGMVGATRDTFYIFAVAHGDTHRVQVYAVSAQGIPGPPSLPSVPYCPADDTGGPVPVASGDPVELEVIFTEDD